MDMVKDRLNRTRAGILWGGALVVILLSWTWVRSVKALPFDNDPAPQAGAKHVSPKKAATAKKPKPAPKPTAGTATSPKTPEESAVAGKRNPFKLPPPPTPGREGTEQVLGPLPPGMRGLVIGQLRVEGIVRLDTNNVMIAVVDNNRNRAYFLRENDAVYNGVVSKITPDSVIFRENALDSSGKVVVRDVVKRLGQGPGA